MLRIFSQAKGLTAEDQEEFRAKFIHLRERLDRLREPPANLLGSAGDVRRPQIPLLNCLLNQFF
jgi:hypothetical protein